MNSSATSSAASLTELLKGASRGSFLKQLSDLSHSAIHIEFRACDIRRVGTCQKENRLSDFIRSPGSFHGNVRDKRAHRLIGDLLRKAMPAQDRRRHWTRAYNIHANPLVGQFRGHGSRK